MSDVKAMIMAWRDKYIIGVNEVTDSIQPDTVNNRSSHLLLRLIWRRLAEWAARPLYPGLSLARPDGTEWWFSRRRHESQTGCWPEPRPEPEGRRPQTGSQSQTGWLCHKENKDTVEVAHTDYSVFILRGKCSDFLNYISIKCFKWV